MTSDSDEMTSDPILARDICLILCERIGLSRLIDITDWIIDNPFCLGRQGERMKKRSFTVLLLLISSVTCSADDVTNSGCPQDGLTPEAHTPFVGHATGICQHSPGISGIPIPIPDGGGYMVQSPVSSCCTDIETTRFSKLNASGEVEWFMDHERGTLIVNSYLPELFAVLDDVFVTSTRRCTGADCNYLQDFNVVLAGWNYEGTEEWVLTSEQLQNANQATMLGITRAGNLLVLLACKVDGLAWSGKVMEISPKGQPNGTWTVDSTGTLLAHTASDNGILVLLESVSNGTETKSYALEGIRITPDGEFAGQITLGTWTFGADAEAPNLYPFVLDGEILVSTDWQKSDTTTSPDWVDILVAQDLTVKWTHKGLWDDGARFTADLIHRRSDMGIDVYDNQSREYRVIRADGEGFDVIVKGIAPPVDNVSEWFLTDWHFYDNGVLTMVAARSPDGLYQAVAANYGPNFGSLKWTLSFGDGCVTPPYLLISDSNWVVVCTKSAAWPECVEDYESLVSSYYFLSLACFDY